MTFTVVSTLWGDKYDAYVPEWLDSVEPLGADAVIVATDRRRNFAGWVEQVVAEPGGRFPAPFYLNLACERAVTKVLWICDMDDRIKPDAVDILDDSVDIVGAGYQRSDGFVYIPEQFTNVDMLAMSWNPIPASSPFKREVWQANPYPDIAHQDWGFWRKAMRAGFTYKTSGRVVYDYAWHPESSLSGTHANNNIAVSEALSC